MDWLEAKFRELEIEAELESLKKEVYKQSNGKTCHNSYQANDKKTPLSTENLNDYYSVLNLQPGASSKDIKQAYRNLVLVWHPDRYPGNPQLQKMAEEKIKEINEAYGKLYSR